MEHQENDGVEKTAAEQYYDLHIAPKLRAIGKECQENGLSFLAMSEWEPGSFGRMFFMQPESGIGFRVADAAVQSNGNIDSLIRAIVQHAKKHGHNSIYLDRLGIPANPAPPDASITE